MFNNITNIEDNLSKIKNSEDVKKNDIIRQRMDTIFGYTDKSNSAEAFKKQVEKFMKGNDKRNTLSVLNMYDTFSEIPFL